MAQPPATPGKPVARSEEPAIIMPRTTATDTETVTVACKVPQGMQLRVFTMEEIDIPLMGGGFKRVKQAIALEEIVVISGPSHPQDCAPEIQIVGKYALTHNVPKGFFDQWMEQNAKSDMVKNHLIWALPVNKAEGQAREMTELKSGLERLDPKKLPGRLTKADEK